jgi:glycosyltransferase involved in cell wall biosynthesis
VVQTPDFSVDFVSKSNFWADPTHIRPYPVLLLKGMLESAGFAPLAGGCRPLGPQAPLDVVAVGRLRRPSKVADLAAVPSPARARRQARVLHLGLFGSDSGMGHASRGLLDTAVLDQHDIELVRVDVAANEGAELPDGTYPFAEALGMYGDLAVIDVPIGWLPEVLPRARAGRRVLRFAFEAFPLPGYISDAMKGTDEIWAMSHYAAEAALASGTDPSLVHIVPPSLGEAWEVTDDHKATAPGAREQGGTKAFSSVFNFEPRKNPEALVRAFRELLKKGLDVKLYLKTSGIDDDNFWAWAQGVLGEKHFDQFKSATKLFTQRFRDDQVRTLLEASDVFVLPTRGEGFGLPFLEAMARGIPVICPDVGGHRDFCDEETSFLVRSRSVPCVAHWDIPLFRESRWREVDFDALVEAMAAAATNPEELAKKAHASLLRAEEFTRADPRSVATRRVVELLQGHDRSAGGEPSAHFARLADDGSIMTPLAEHSPRRLPQVVRS